MPGGPRISGPYHDGLRRAAEIAERTFDEFNYFNIAGRQIAAAILRESEQPRPYDPYGDTEERD